MEIGKERIEELFKKLLDLTKIQQEVDGYDFKNLPTAALLEIFIVGAIANRASDVHFEPEADNIKVRYRIDGQLRDVARFSPDFYKFILSRIKLIANLKLNIAEKPQDGRFTVDFSSKNVEVRLSIIPSEYGETLVMRILDPEVIDIALEELGLRLDDLKIVQEELRAPNGMILNTGPTGSGKTTTLYAFLKKKQTPEIKIITIEDPIEYHLAGIEQTQVVTDGSYNFVTGLKSIMRQDPDVILIGEIRDQETAAIAIQASLTGHLVFSTVHANEAAGAIPRLLDLNVKSTSIGPALNLIMAQRLVRKLCEHCKKRQEIDWALKAKITELLAPSEIKDFDLFEAVGCDLCNNFGYKGRVGVFELLRIDEKIKELIDQQASEAKIRDLAIANGMITMQKDGIFKALHGITSLEEVEAVTGRLLAIKKH
jgi:type II secretory ATPase GspE/PulE/Tfp pilus assembly ATPase PilB-like protein